MAPVRSSSSGLREPVARCQFRNSQTGSPLALPESTLRWSRLLRTSCQAGCISPSDDDRTKTRLPMKPGDYFADEQVATWNVERFWGLPQYPQTPYYRTFETAVSRDAHLYEFVVPMVPPNWNDLARVAAMANQLCTFRETDGSRRLNSRCLWVGDERRHSRLLSALGADSLPAGWAPSCKRQPN